MLCDLCRHFPTSPAHLAGPRAHGPAQSKGRGTKPTPQEGRADGPQPTEPPQGRGKKEPRFSSLSRVGEGGPWALRTLQKTLVLLCSNFQSAHSVLTFSYHLSEGCGETHPLISQKNQLFVVLGINKIFKKSFRSSHSISTSFLSYSASRWTHVGGSFVSCGVCVCIVCCRRVGTPRCLLMQLFCATEERSMSKVRCCDKKVHPTHDVHVFSFSWPRCLCADVGVAHCSWHSCQSVAA